MSNHAPDAVPPAPPELRWEPARDGQAPIFIALLWGVVGVGVLARLTRYIAGWPLWGDEASLAVAFVDRDYLGLLEPLDHGQVAPPGYLWLVKALVDALGFHVHTLRLVAIVAGLACLPLIYRIGRSVGGPWHAGFGLAVFAVSTYPIRYAAEVKQYALDAVGAALLVVLGLGLMGGRRSAGVALLLLTPVVMSSSHPAVFVAGGLTIAIALTAPPGRRQARLAWAAGLGLVTTATFGGLYALAMSDQLAVHGDGMVRHWSSGFIGASSPLALLLWFVRLLTGELFALPIGGKNFGSVVPAVFFWMGVVAIWRHGRRDLLYVIAGTVGLALIAAALRKYPLGDHPRVVQYLTPMFSVVIGVGIAWLVARLTVRMQRPGVAVMVILLVIGLAVTLRDVSRASHGRTPAEWRRGARMIWEDYRTLGELRCANQAWREAFPGAKASAKYYDAYRALYAPDVVRLAEPYPGDLSGPTGLVIFTRTPDADQPLVDAWVNELTRRYDVSRHDTLPVDLGKHGREAYHVVWVSPKAPDSPAADPAQSPTPDADPS